MTGQLRQVLRGHDGPVTGARFRDDGATLVSAGLDGTLRAWNARSGLSEGIFGGGLGPITALDVDGERVAVGTAAGRVQSFDGLVPRGEAAGPLTGAVIDLRLSPRGVVALTDDHVLRSLRGGVDRLLQDGVAALSRPASPLLGMLDGSVVDPDGPPRVASGSRVESVAARGEWLAAGRADGSITVARGDERFELLGHRGPVRSLVFGAEGLRAASASHDGSVRLWDLQARRPAWRGIALLSEPPRLVSHRGWEGADGVPRRAPEGAWAEALAGADFAVQGDSTTVVCVQTKDAVALWDGSADRLLQEVGMRPTHLVATPAGCVARTGDGAVTVLRGGDEPARIPLPAPARAVGWGEQRVLVATDERVLAFTESGDPLGEVPHDVSAVTAVTQIGTRLVLGSADGRLSAVSTTGEGLVRLERSAAAATLPLAASAGDTLVSGYADGTVTLHSLDGGIALAKHRLHGAVVHLRPTGVGLVAATDLGDQLRWNLDVLDRPYCELLREVWAEVAVVWERGRPIARPPPADHPCR